MKLFYFDVYHNDVKSCDDCGVECENLLHAKAQAQLLVIGLAQENSSDQNNKDIICVVRCAEGIVRYKTLLSLRSEWEEPSDRELAQFPEGAYRFVR